VESEKSIIDVQELVATEDLLKNGRNVMKPKRTPQTVNDRPDGDRTDVTQTRTLTNHVFLGKNLTTQWVRLSGHRV
jgi:hypothetical protein